MWVDELNGRMASEECERRHARVRGPFSSWRRLLCHLAHALLLLLLLSTISVSVAGDGQSIGC